jgi:hypothetical protein
VRRVLVSATVLFALLGVLAATSPADTHDSDTGCNIRLEVSEDAERPATQARQPAREAHHGHRHQRASAAHPTPKTRSSNFSRRVWRVGAQITEFKVEGDGDFTWCCSVMAVT